MKYIVSLFLIFSFLFIFLILPDDVSAQACGTLSVDRYSCHSPIDFLQSCTFENVVPDNVENCSMSGGNCQTAGGVCSSNDTCTYIPRRPNMVTCSTTSYGFCDDISERSECRTGFASTCQDGWIPSSCSCSNSPSGCNILTSPTPTPTPTPSGSTPTPTPAPGSSPTPPPGNVDGWHDGNSGNQLSGSCEVWGWAADPDNRTTDLAVRVLANGVQVAFGPAGIFRGDLQTAGVCTGGTCAFDWNISGLVPNGVPQTIQVQAQDLQSGAYMNLNGTPKTLTCCGAVSAPTVTAPTSPLACGATTTNITWTGDPDASAYALRVDDTSNPWTGTCASVNAGDVCIDNQVGTTYNKAIVAGRTYNVWVHALNSCGEWSAPSPTFTFTAMGSLTLSGSQNIQTGTSTTFTANLNPAVSVGRVDFSTSNNGVATLTPASDNNAAGGYTTSVQGASAGTSNIGASAYSTGGALLCSAPTVPVTVSASTAAWWQVRGADVNVAGSLTSMIPNTCSGACTPIFNLRNTQVPTGNMNHFNGTGDFSAVGGAGTGAQPVDWKVNSGTQIGQTYNYNFFRNAVPSSWETNIINIPGSTLDVTQIPTMGSAVGGYYVLYRNGDLTLTGDSGITNNKYIFFVENGDLTLGNAAASRFIVNDGVGFLMAIVGRGTNPAKGNIIVSPAVVSATQTDYRYEGMFLAEGQFRTSSGGRLSLRGSYAALGGFVLGRDLADDSATPAEFFDFAPHLLMTYPIALTNKRIHWQEVAP